MNDTNPAPTVKRGRGRPKGTKNKDPYMRNIPTPTPSIIAPLKPEINMVAQINDMENPLVGVMFIIGGIRGIDVHGFFLTKSLEKEFVTTTLNAIKIIGKSAVTSREPCSPDWNKAQNEETKAIKAIDETPQTPGEINL